MMPCPLLFLSLLSLVAAFDVIDVQLDEAELDGADRWEFRFLLRTIQILQLARHFCCGLVQGKCAGVRRFWELKIWDFGERKDLFSGLCWAWVQPQVPGQLWALQHKVSLELDRMRFFPRCGPYQCSSVTNACSSSSSTPTTTVIFQILDQMAMFWILINLFCWGLWIGHSYIGWRQSTREQPCGEISRAFERFCLDMIPLKSRFCIIIRFGHDWLTLLVMPGLEYWRQRTATRRKAENTILRCFPVGEHKIPIGYQCRLKYTGVVQFGEYVQEGDLAAAADPDVVARCEKILKKGVWSILSGSTRLVESSLEAESLIVFWPASSGGLHLMDTFELKENLAQRGRRKTGWHPCAGSSSIIVGAWWSHRSY